jgi:hypothetical protein
LEKFISFATLTDVEGEEQEISTHKELYKQIVFYPSFEGLTILFK